MAPNRNVLAAHRRRHHRRRLGESYAGERGRTGLAAGHSAPAPMPGAASPSIIGLQTAGATVSTGSRSQAPLVAAGCWSVRVQAHAWRERSRLHRVAVRGLVRVGLRASGDASTSTKGRGTIPNGPYYGGLQMDLAFQRAHGWDFYRRWGTADSWPVWAQLVTAERAYRTRGFQPWPTARYC